MHDWEIGLLSGMYMARGGSGKAICFLMVEGL